MEKRSTPGIFGPGPSPTLVRYALAYAVVNGALVLIWAATGKSAFWPSWTLIVFAVPVAVQAWHEIVAAHPGVWARLRLTPSLAEWIGRLLIADVFLIAVWAASSSTDFWPVWVLIATAVLIGSRWAVAASRDDRGRRELGERIEHLETTRAGAVDVQEDQLRRIERDLHDGAQARLVSLGMSLGMAEQKLDSDPEAARELVTEARAGVGEALKELRDLVRGIHPPLLTDRGLEAAIGSLVDASPLPVTVSVDVSSRPPAAVESAAYFVVAEALANAGKHAGATSVDVAVAGRGGLLTVRVADDGCGGADPGGSGLAGLRRRVEALDGNLSVWSPAGGPTVVAAELPCAS